MFKNQLILLIFLLLFNSSFTQTYYAGFKTLKLKDSTRIYKPHTTPNDGLYYRPVDLDIWYPSNETKHKPLLFGDIFKLFEERAINYQDNEDFSGMTNELAQFYVAELGMGINGERLLDVKTSSYPDVYPISEKRPIILYMAGFNGMGFENFKLLETLAQNGYVIVSIWSVGRYPGNMTNKKEDLMEQVYDAEFAIQYFKKNNLFHIDFSNIGVIGYSWGGMGTVAFIKRNPIVKAFLSLDGTETHYFGESEEDDRLIQEIHHSNLLEPLSQKINYLYLESGNKLNEFEPTHEYNYYNKIDTNKFYLRFKNSSHIDFTCIPSILKTSEASVNTYREIENITLSFFNKLFAKENKFSVYLKSLKALKYTTDIPYDISSKTELGLSKRKIAGFVVNKSNNKPLPYVNIGILNQEIGTVTNSEGKFTFDLKKEFMNDTIKISSIGYKTQKITLKDIKEKNEALLIALEEEINELHEVIIETKALKKKTLGNKSESKFVSTGFSYDQLGAEMGIKINIRKNPTFVDAFNFNIPYNRLSRKSTFRVNFYKRSDKYSFENILNKNIFISIEPKQVGKIKVNLKPYNIVLRDDVIVTLEWVETEGENNKGEAIFFSLGLLNSGTLYKKLVNQNLRNIVVWE